MKNEKANTQNGNQDQAVNNPINQQPGMQQQTTNEDTDLSMARPGMNESSQGQKNKNQQTQGAAKGNISVDNEGRIGKAHDQWDNDNNNRNKDEKQEANRAQNDKSTTTPEIDAPIYDPEKTEKKIPQMEADKKNK